MLVSEAWLREWVSPKVSTQALSDLLTMAGLEVETVEPLDRLGELVVVGEVTAIEKHPDAKKLNICTVDAGQGEALTIVCGAANAAQGIKAPVALVGCELPDGMKIESRDVRGVISSGMLCAAAELGMEEKSDGLLLLDADAPVGETLDRYLNTDDVCIDIDLTPNRGDCLSITGVAREVAVMTDTPMAAIDVPAVPASIKDTRAVDLNASAHCSRYAGRVINNVKLNQQTPDWMKEKLRRSGVRSISPIVDVTNFVMLELGQPMHAFDAKKIEGDIQVRLAEKDETLILLDGRELALTPDMLVIADEKKAVALAGIMGGENSEVDDTTADIILEAAYFSPLGIAGRARELGMQTDASHRFERGVDASQQARAIERATALLVDIVGGEPGPVFEASVAAHLPQAQPIDLRLARLCSMLGIEVSAADVETYLTQLGFAITPLDAGEAWQVTAPSWRFDIAGEHDLVEEVGRAVGFDVVPPAYPQIRGQAPQQAENELTTHDVRSTLAAAGYHEVVSYSFVDPAEQAILGNAAPVVALGNPIASNMSVMRTSLWTGLLGTARTNLHRQIRRMNLFEVGQVFVADPQSDTGAAESARLGLLKLGAPVEKTWATTARNVDFFDLKGDVENLFARLNVGVPQCQPLENPALHPGQSAEIRLGDTPIGLIGQCHPAVIEQFDIDVEVFLAELDLRALAHRTLPAYQVMSRFPATSRDLSLRVPEGVSAAELFAQMRQAGGSLLKNIQLFDNYTGAGLGEGEKSLAFALTFQSQEGSLDAASVDELVGEILANLQSQFQVQLRT